MIAKLTTFLGLLTCNEAHPFTECNTNTIGINTVQLNPDPPITNSNLQVVLNGTSSEDVTDPTIHLEISVLDIPVYHLDIDVCSTNPCPILKNTPYSLEFNYKIPNEQIGNVNVGVKLSLLEKKVSVGCVELQTPIHSPNNVFMNTIRPVYASGKFIEYLFNHWQHHYDINYRTTDEYKSRLDIFKTNTLYIINHRHTGFTLGHNLFSDLTQAEFAQRLGYKILPNPSSETKTKDDGGNADNELPPQVDWRTKGAVTPVKNQGQCGSCWTFSTTGALEGAYYLKTGTLVAFSEQELVSCDKVDQGCNGGLMDNAFEWIHNHSGLCAEADYPYVSGDGTAPQCSKGCIPVDNSTVTGFVDIPQSTASLQEAVSKQPVAVAIEADHMSFQFYSKGVYHSDCGTSLDHGVLIVGYGTLNNLDYWIVKNSWSEKWGNKGYIYIQKGGQHTGGECGIQLSASYPVV